MKYMLIFLLVCTGLACNSEQKSGYEEYQDAMESSGDFNPYATSSDDKPLLGLINSFVSTEIEESPRTTFSSPPPSYLGEPQLAYADNQPLAKPISSVEKKLVRTAYIEIKVENYKTAHTALSGLLQKYKAEISNEAQNRTSDGYRYNFQIRVLPADFDGFLAEIETIASFVYSKNIQVADVTKQYVDLETRVAAKRAVLAQYRELLKGAKTVTDVLAVSEKLNEITEEMESNEAQLRVLKDQVQLCTIDLAIFDEFLLPDVAQRNFWNRLGEGLFNGWNILLSIIIGLVTAWPVVLIITTVFWLGRKAWKRRRERKVAS